MMIFLVANFTKNFFSEMFVGLRQRWRKLLFRVENPILWVMSRRLYYLNSFFSCLLLIYRCIGLMYISNSVLIIGPLEAISPLVSWAKNCKHIYNVLLFSFSAISKLSLNAYKYMKTYLYWNMLCAQLHMFSQNFL